MNSALAMSLFAAAEGAASTGPGEFSTFIKLLTVFLLAMWVGFEVITKVPPILHTPLTSGSNAISGITIVGSMVALGSMAGWFTSVLGFGATVFAAINVVGGFLVTHRMLRMFKKR
jgi:H+-translocating NAD(P) transhydrogenase subunit alpha